MSRRVLWLAAPLLGLTAYFAIMGLSTGDPLAMIRGAEHNGSGFSAGALLHPLDVFGQLVAQPLLIHLYQYSLMDRAFFLVFLALLTPLFRRLPLPLAIYAAAMGLISVLGGSYESYMRYLLVAFPVFVVVPLLLEGKRAWLWTPLLFLFTMLQGLFLVMQSTFYWVA